MDNLSPKHHHCSNKKAPPNKLDGRNRHRLHGFIIMTHFSSPVLTGADSMGIISALRTPNVSNI